jgi:CheY-like chemotaxis protein
MAVDVVLDGEDALESPAVTRYDVAVLDRDLPGIHGDEVRRRIVAGGAGSRVLMLTAASTVAGVLRPARARAFLITVASRDDYPRHLGYLLRGATDEQVVTLAREVLKVRRATEYAPLVITECSAAELPPTLAGLMLDINAYLTAARAAASPPLRCSRPPGPWRGWNPSSRSRSCRSRGPPSGRSRPCRPAPSPHRE